MSRIAIVTGGTAGIGAATSEALAAAGYRVIATYGHNEEHARTFTHHTGIPVRKWDVADYDSCLAGVGEVAASFGPVEILVNNAGITADCMLHKMSPVQWHRVIETDLTSCFNMCRAVINGMRERHFGRIVNIGSVNGQSGQLGQTNYAAAKAGMIGFSKSLALENAARGITVNVVAPGYTNTPMVEAVAAATMEKIVASTPVGRLAEVAEIARAVVFLVADEAGFVTGSTLSINGGRYLA